MATATPNSNFTNASIIFLPRIAPYASIPDLVHLGLSNSKVNKILNNNFLAEKNQTHVKILIVEEPQSRQISASVLHLLNLLAQNKTIFGAISGSQLDPHYFDIQLPKINRALYLRLFMSANWVTILQHGCSFINSVPSLPSQDCQAIHSLFEEKLSTARDREEIIIHAQTAWSLLTNLFFVHSVSAIGAVDVWSDKFHADFQKKIREEVYKIHMGNSWVQLHQLMVAHTPILSKSIQNKFWDIFISPLKPELQNSLSQWDSFGGSNTLALIKNITGDDLQTIYAHETHCISLYLSFFALVTSMKFDTHILSDLYDEIYNGLLDSSSSREHDNFLESFKDTEHQLATISYPIDQLNQEYSQETIRVLFSMWKKTFGRT